ncbi:MAG: immunoglobulin domain-containing protein [Ignavibacteria bacterium]|nr:immunoglobulin domain-containing protein [Ignavibacteria bacterium]
MRIKLLLNISIIIITFISLSVLECAAAFPRITGYIGNNGQWPHKVLFLNRQPNLDIWVTWSGVVYDQYQIKDGIRKGHVLRMKWMNASVMPNIEAKQTGDARRVSFFTSSDRKKWITDIQISNEIRMRNLYPGIDLIYYLDKDGRVRYDFDVHPEANVQAVGFTVEGDVGLNISPTEVSLSTTLGTIAMTDLYAYVLGRKSLGVPATFVANSNGISFSIPMNTGKVPLRVDPVVYGTYLGGDDDDEVKAIKTVSDGVFVGGTTSSLSFPENLGAYSYEVRGQTDAFIAKLSANLSSVIVYTYFGGDGTERLADIDVDSDGNVYATGETTSDDMPISIGSVGQIYKGQIDGFILKMPPSLNSLTISTYIGGNKDDKPTAIAAETGGTVFIAGGTTSVTGFPVTLAQQSAIGGQTDGFLARLSATGGSFNFCTYFGKSGNEIFTALALDAAASPYVTGWTTSPDFETAPTPGHFSSGRLPYDRSFNGGTTDAFLIKFFSDGTLSKNDDGTFSTFFGGNAEDEGRGVFVDATGRPVLVGVTTSTDLPAIGTISTAPIGQRDIFMAVFTDDGRGLSSCTYYGGTGDDDVFGIEPMPSFNSGVMYGATSSNDFPVTGTGSVSDRSGSSDGFLAEINTVTNILNTLITGNSADTIIGVSLDSKADIYFTWTGDSEDLFVHDSALQNKKSDGLDGYVGKWARGTLSLASPSGGETWCGGTTKNISWAGQGMNPNETYDVLLSADSGATWKLIANDVVTQSYNWEIPATLDAGTAYVMAVTTQRGHQVESNVFTIATPPSITASPSSMLTCLGMSYALSVTATGSNLRYQWRKNGANISGAIYSVYLISSISQSDIGSYDVVVSGTCSPSVTSTIATVGVAPVTAITQQPSGVSVNSGEPFTLTVSAAGTDLAYQWQLNEYEISGAKSAVYTVTSAAMNDAGLYRCVVTGRCGIDTSDAATVVVSPISSVDTDFSRDVATMHVIGPNPASTEIAVEFSLHTASDLTIRLVDFRGGVVWAMHETLYPAGQSILYIPVFKLISGVYGIEAVIGRQSLRSAINVTH